MRFSEDYKFVEIHSLIPFPFSMQKKYSLLLALGVLISSLSSCSRANYAFNTTAPAYGGSEQVQPSGLASEASVTASLQEPTPQRVEVSPARQAAASLAHRAVAAPTQALPASATQSTSLAAPQGKLDHTTRKVLRQELKRQIASAPKEQVASGKSQLVALLLVIFLGGLGIHRFYLGYIGRGILYIGLAVTSFLIVPAIALLALLIIDLIKIITGSLKPKGGEYAKTL
jgi:TM2 domain-containing membrane protein YozV